MQSLYQAALRVTDELARAGKFEESSPANTKAHVQCSVYNNLGQLVDQLEVSRFAVSDSFSVHGRPLAGVRLRVCGV